MSETKASDLVSTLRGLNKGVVGRVGADAAAEIESLRAQLAAAEAKTTILLHSEVYHKDRADTAESRLKIAREALEAMLVDPPATLDEPDTDAEVTIKMREIASAALRSLTEGEGK